MGRVVIAGGTGFLGQSLARDLTSRGTDVVTMDAVKSQFRRLADQYDGEVAA